MCNAQHWSAVALGPAKPGKPLKSPGGNWGNLENLRKLFPCHICRVTLQGASWTRQELSKISIHTPRSLLSTANNCCGFEIRSPSGNRGQDNYPHDRKSPSAFFPVNTNAFSFPTVHCKSLLQRLQSLKTRTQGRKGRRFVCTLASR